MVGTGKKIFANRQDAGEQLGLALQKTYKDKNALVLGVPRGGVEVAYYAAKLLNAELSVIVSKKIPAPGNEEYGIGAIAEDHSVYISPIEKTHYPLQTINEITERQREEVSRRALEYRNGQPLPPMKGRIVLLIDDGIATGATLVPAIELCKKREAAKVVIAAPVAGRSYNEALKQADEVIILQQPFPFYAVGQVYEDFPPLTDEEVKAFLDGSD